MNDTQNERPEWLIELQNALFENTPAETHSSLTEAIKPRSDDEWLVVMHNIHYRILNDVALPNAGLAKDAVLAVMALHEKREPAESAAWKTIMQIVLEEIA